MELEQFDGIRYSKYDATRNLLLAWHGGHGIHAYNDRGAECCFWNMGGAESPTSAQAEENITAHIEAGDYLEYF